VNTLVHEKKELTAQEVLVPIVTHKGGFFRRGKGKSQRRKFLPDR